MLTMTLLAAAPLAIAGPPSKATVAEKRHKQAVKLYRRGRLQGAIESWLAAEALAPHWKYSFNLSAALADAKQWLPAMEALDRAQQRGLPVKFDAPAKALSKRVRAGLLETHAEVILDVPDGGVVRRDGKPLSAPYRFWTNKAKSTLELRLPGRPPRTRVIDHEPGVRHRVSLVGAASPTTGTLEIIGAPAGASIRVDGELVGALPRWVGREIAAGPHDVEVSAPDRSGERRHVTVTPAGTTRLSFDLPRLDVAAVSDPARPTRWGWLVLGTGVVVGAVGGGLLLWSEQLVAEAEELNADYASSDAGKQAEYDGRFIELENREGRVRTAGYVLLGLGSAAALTGLIVQLATLRGERSTRVGPMLLPGGGGARVQIGF